MARTVNGLPGVYNSSALSLADGEGAALALDSSGNAKVNVSVSALPAYSTPACGELQGSTSALQLPSVACKMVQFVASASNAGNVYLGGPNVTKPDGTTDTTTGMQLSPGQSSLWTPITNLNILYRICDNAGDALTYLSFS